MTTPEDLKLRTRRFAAEIVRLAESLPHNRTTEILGRQIIRCATSVGANYRAACRARSKADFVSKMSVVQEEADETQHWLELMLDLGIISSESYLPNFKEAGELTAIFTASTKTARANK
jgi:four helix bundle protein